MNKIDISDHYRRAIGVGLLLLGLSLALKQAQGASAGNYLVLHPFPAQDGDFPIVQGADDLFRPAVVDGNLVIWYTRGQDGLDVLGLRLDDDEHVEHVPFLIGGGSGDQAVPAAAFSTEGGNCLVVWHSQPSSDAKADVYARYLDDGGRPVAAPFAISTAEGHQFRSAVAYAPAADAFIVVWQDDRAGDSFDLYARLVSARAQGRAPVLSEEFIVSDSASDQLIPAVACEVAEPRCLVVWMDNRQAAVFNTDIMGRLVDIADGRAVGNEVDIAVARWYQDSPTAVYNPVSAEYMVVWNDDISCRRVSRDGRPQGNRIDVSLESPFQYKPAVAVDADGRYLVVWEDGRNQGSRGTDVYGQWLSPDGLPVGRNFDLSADTHNQYAPTLVFDPGRKEFFVVWEDDRDNGYLALYGRTLSYDPESQ